jgi:hypothetical protein
MCEAYSLGSFFVSNSDVSQLKESYVFIENDLLTDLTVCKIGTVTLLDNY